MPEPEITPGDWKLDYEPYEDGSLFSPLITAHDEDGNIFSVAEVTVEGLLVGDWEENAKLIAAAGTSSNELHDSYDPIETQKYLYEVVEALQSNHDSGHTDTCDAVLGDHDCTCGWQDAHDALQKIQKDNE